MEILLCIHLGLGDLINYIPAIKVLSDTDNIMIPCYEKYIPNASQMLSGMNVDLISIPDNRPDRVEELMKEFKSRGDRVIGLGCYSEEPLDVTGHIRQGYKKLEIGYKYAINQNIIEKQANKADWLPVPEYDYALICEDSSEGLMKINREHIDKVLTELSPPKETLMLSYTDIIYNAKEIHCIDTSWLWLVNNLPTKGRLFFHRYARNNGHRYDDMFFKEWIVL